ncbi:MAG: hypothetical protein OSJ61_20520 [Lachnospiraceae bacterium]|nr:hypothetical protein [Lachnospiraceae bacterium]
MKIWKLVSGILCIICSCVIVFQSCAAGLSNTMEANGEVSGTAGVFVAILILTGGIASIATSNKKAGNAAIAIIFAIAAIIGYALYGSFADLAIWATWALICGIMSVVALIMEDKAQ